MDQCDAFFECFLIRIRIRVFLFGQSIWTGPRFESSGIRSPACLYATLQLCFRAIKCNPSAGDQWYSQYFCQMVTRDTMRACKNNFYLATAFYLNRNVMNMLTLHVRNNLCSYQLILVPWQLQYSQLSTYMFVFRLLSIYLTLLLLRRGRGGQGYTY